MKAKYQGQLQAYGAFSDKMGLPSQMDRVYQDELNWRANVVTKEDKNQVAKTKDTGIIKSRSVSGARNPYSQTADEHAKRYYGLVRSMKTDVSRISKTTGMSEADIRSIKEYLFIQEHDLGNGEVKCFDPDYMIAESWRRMIDRKPEPHDITLLKHELMEKELMSKGMPQDEAHRITSAKYNYDKEAIEYYGKIKKFKEK